MSYSTRDVSLNNEDTIKFWPSSAAGSAPKNFLKDSLTLQDRTFSTLPRISGKNDSFYMKIS